MAEIRLTKEQAASAEGWPRLCVRCAAPADTFSAVPEKKRGKGVEMLNVPLCPAHENHWTDHARQTRWAIFSILAAMIITGLVLCFGPEAVRFGWGPAGFNLGVIVFVPLFVALVVGVVLAARIGNSIRVSEVNKHWLTLQGVSSKFAKAWTTSGAVVGELGDASIKEVGARLEAVPYKTDGVCPSEGLYRLFGTALGAGLFLGSAVAVAAWWLEEHTRGWNVNDLRYLALIAGMLVAHGLLFWTFIVGRPLLLFLVVYAGAALVLTAIAGVLALIPGRGGAVSMLTLTSSAWACVYLAPFVFLGLLMNLQVHVQKIRGPALAWLAGLLGPLLALVVAWWRVWETPAFGWSLPICGGIVTALTPFLCMSSARQPFCRRCESWMIREVLGGLSRPAELVAEVLKSGEIVRLANEQVRAEAEVGDVEIGLYYCSNCREEGKLVLHAVALTKEGKNQSRKDLGYWVYAGEAWPVVRVLFPQWKPLEE